MYNIKIYLKAIKQRMEEIAKEVDYIVENLNDEQIQEMAELSAMEDVLKNALLKTEEEEGWF